MKLFSVFLFGFLFVAASLAADFSVTAEQLIAEINIRKTKVLEFKQLHDYGKEHGIRIWVAGGSAAGLAHYVKDDLENEFLKSQGKKPLYFEGRFGYNYFDIYRSTQDCDVIINGDEKQAQELEAFINDKFDHLQGGKEVFEVRLLDKPRGIGAGEKDALLNNPDFSNQHPDSHSTGMVELTQPPITESAVRDLFDWDNQKDHKFIIDVVDNQLSYYFNKKHNTTKIFKDGINPPILSVLRYYTNLFQYGLKPRPEDEKFLIQIIENFNPKDTAWNESYVNKQINKNGIKMIRHAQDMEFAINTIERVGLKDKLLKFVAQGAEQVSLWVNKEPLRSFPLARKPGKTAAELGITIVAHETRDFLAYESITMSRRGVPNVFSSREGPEEEDAALGEGFYAKMGYEGARGTGLTIRYAVDPRAVEGVDFFFVPGVEYVIFVNRNALKVIDESIELTPADYFKILFEQDISKSEKGVWHKIELKVKAKMKNITKDDLDLIVKMVKDELQKKSPKWSIMAKWFELQVSINYPEIVKDIIKTGKYSREIVEYVLSQSTWMRADQSVEFLKAGVTPGKDKATDGAICKYIFSKQYWSNFEFAPVWIKNIFDSNELDVDKDLIEYVLSKPFWANDMGAGIVKKLMLRSGWERKELIMKYILTQPYWVQHHLSSEFVETLLQSYDSDAYGVVSKNLSLEMWSKHPKAVDFLRMAIEYDRSAALLEFLITKPYWFEHILESNLLDVILVEENRSFRVEKPLAEYLVQILDEGAISWDLIVQKVLSNSLWSQNPKGPALLEKIILAGRNDKSINNSILSNPAWADQPRLKKLCGDKEVNVQNIREGLEREIEQGLIDCSKALE